MNKTRWSKQEITILKTNYQKMPRKELLKLLPNRTLGGINIKARSLNLHNYIGNHSWHSTIEYNKNYFSIVNQETSYWAGFLAADAYIDSKNNKIRIKLAAKDKQQLMDFKQCLNFSGVIREYTRNTNKGFNFKTVYLDLCGASQIIKDLKLNFNIDSKNKSSNLKAPFKLITINALAYIKGLIDGDGSITKTGLRFELLTTKFIADWCINIFSDLDYRVNQKNKTNTKLDLVVVYKQNINLLYLIKSSCYLGLDRKWSRLPLRSNS